MRIDFWTSTEYSGFMAGLIRELNARGLEANQRYHISEASYRAAKSLGARLFLRFRQYVGYPVQLIVALASRRLFSFLFSCSQLKMEGDFAGGARQPGTGKLKTGKPVGGDDVCIVSTNTFYAPLIATLVHPNVVHLVYDLFPEAMIHSGKWQEGTLKVKLVRWITKQTLKRATMNVFLGQRLKDYVESIHGPVPNATIIGVEADQALFADSPTKRESAKMVRHEARPEGVTESGALRAMKEQMQYLSDVGASAPSHLPNFTPSHLPTLIPSHSAPAVLYCGNFGNMHDSATLFDYWKRSDEQEDSLQWVFHCAGPKRAALEQVVADLPTVMKNQIHLGDGLSQEAWVAAMECAEVALVTMAPGAETVVMPSKTYSAMMAGQAILGIAPKDSDLVDTIKAADCGWWLAPGDVDGLAQKVIELTGSKSQIVYRSMPEDDPKQRQPDITQAKAVLGWEPKIQLEAGLKKTINYFDGQLSSCS